MRGMLGILKIGWHHEVYRPMCRDDGLFLLPKSRKQIEKTPLRREREWKYMDKIGRFGEFGGQYVPETVMRAVNELNEAYDRYKDDPQFIKELDALYRDYAGRPSML